MRGTAVETGEDGTFAQTVAANGGRESERRALDLVAGDVNRIVIS